MTDINERISRLYKAIGAKMPDPNVKWMLDGHTPIQAPDLMTWAHWYEVAANRIVARWEQDDVTVSTVFLSIDHSFSGTGPPILFETMVFGGALDGEQDRYSTWVEAAAGHVVMVARVSDAQRRGEGQL